jgi:hypothetical protein
LKKQIQSQETKIRGQGNMIKKLEKENQGDKKLIKMVKVIENQTKKID